MRGSQPWSPSFPSGLPPSPRARDGSGPRPSASPVRSSRGDRRRRSPRRCGSPSSRCDPPRGETRNPPFLIRRFRAQSLPRAPRFRSSSTRLSASGPMAVTAWVGWRLRTAPGNRRAASDGPVQRGDFTRQFHPSALNSGGIGSMQFRHGNQGSTSAAGV